MYKLLVSGALLLPVLVHAAVETVPESERALPMAADVDLVVVGGSSTGVAAAAAAARAGASVFLAAPRMYLGEDLCAPCQLWLPPGEKPESPLAQAMFPDLKQDQGLAFEYTASRPSTGKHVDTTPPRMLNDGHWNSVFKQSVEFADDVEIVADLGAPKSLHEVRAMVFQSPGRYAVRAIAIATSADRKSWQEAGILDNPSCTTASSTAEALSLTAPLVRQARYVRFQVRKCDQSPRLLLGELQLLETPQPDPLAAARVRNTTPMQVKTALEEELLAAGVAFVYGSPVTDLLRDDAGRIAGVAIANRAGRQAIRAKMVLDATTGAWLARQAGATAQPPPAGKRDFKRIVIGGKMRSGPGIVTARVLPLRTPIGGVGPATFGSPGFGNRVQKINAPMQTSHGEAIEYTLRLPMTDGSFAALAEAEQMARDLTFDPEQVEESETLLPLTPEQVTGQDLPGYRRVPAGTGTLSERLDLAAALGRDAARATKKQTAPQGVRVAGDAATASAQADGDVRESLADFRPLAAPKATVPSPARTLPVLGDYDVVVLGGGTSGAPAAIAAARSGAKTLVIEYLHALGGTGTVGLIGIYCAGYREGFTAEVDRGIEAIGSPTYVVGKQEYWRREVRTAGGHIWFGVLGCGAYRRGDRVAGVVVATPAGRGVVLAKVVIDGTGNADLAAAAGAETAYNSADDEAMQGTGLPYRAPGASYINTDWTYVDEMDMVDVTTSLIAAKRKFRGCYDLCQLIDTRERRRVVGDYTLDPLDIINQRRFPDT
ncbi:MAG: FAD-dependent oxidoreductase, partial [Lentisphaeria bacterium]|nr:FAD-dependent oxidoreductase [Lentisphaeria bacterium]